MTTQADSPRESSVTPDIIRKIHVTLSDVKTGEDILAFLRTTEPVFMNEVNKFIQTEVARMRYQLSESQASYFGSVIGAAYIAGFLIAREANHYMFKDIFDVKSDIQEALTTEEFDKIVDQKRKEGKGYREIAKVIRRMIEKGNEEAPSKKNKEKLPEYGSKLDIGDLD